MQKRTVLGLLILMAAIAVGQSPMGPVSLTATPMDAKAALLAQAETLRAEGSYRSAREAYDQLLAMEGLEQALEQQARFGRADAMWRERAGDEEEARKTLTRMVEDLPAGGRWHAEAAESLGDLISQTNPWEQTNRDAMFAAWIKAIDYWGHATDVKAAQPRYVELNLKVADQVINRWGGIIPLPRVTGLAHPDILPPPPPENEPWRGDVASWALRNVLRVSEEPVDQARAYLLLGRLRVRNRYADDETWRREAEEYLKQAVAVEPATEWTDDGYWELSQLLNQQARYVEAAATLKAFLEAYPEGTSAYVDNARNTLSQIVDLQIGLSVNRAFAPGSYVRADLYYRNCGAAAIVVRRVTAEAWLDYQRTEDSSTERLSRLGEEIRRIEVEGVTDEGRHEPRNATAYQEPLQAGIYVLVAEGTAGRDGVEKLSGEPAAQTVFVTGTGVAAKHHGLTSTVWVTDAETGRPAEGAEVNLLYGYRLRDQQGGRERLRWELARGSSGAEGLARFDRRPPRVDEREYGEIHVLALRDGEPATVEQRYYGESRREADQGRAVMYAWSDRPAYRPGETINWRGILRFTKGEEYTLPGAERVLVRLRDARGNMIKDETVAVDRNGSFGATFSVDRSAALGIVNIEVSEDGTRRWTQTAQLCRIEEYKLPEFVVNVAPPSEQMRFGEKVTFAVAAEYYFGGPVAGATVEIVVHRGAFWPRWQPPMPYEWLYAGGGEMRMMRGWGDHSWFPREPEQIVLRKTVTLDAEGRAEIEVGALEAEEIRGARERGIWGYEYRVEARVTDLSRREIVGNGSVKVGRSAFAAYLNPQRFVYLPGNPVKVDLKTLDPNDQPVKAEGLVRIYKRVWNAEKKNAQGEAAPDYDDTELFARPAATGEDGEGEVTFEPNEEGYYLARFETRDRFGEPIGGETTVFVCSETSDAVGYLSGGLEIILDKKSYRRGETAHAMITTRRPGVAVWLGVEGEAIHETRVVRLDGTVKLVPIEVAPEYEPNVFLTAVAMYDYSGFRATQQLMVPPTRRFLDVKLTTEKADYRPGEKATIEIQVKDDEGRPVSAPLALGVADAAVWAIQEELAPDIRQFFWGQQRALSIQTMSSAESYAIVLWKPVDGKPGEYEAWRREEIGARDEDKRIAGDLGAPGQDVYFARGGAMAMPAAAPMVADATMEMAEGRTMTLKSMAPPGESEAAGAEPRVRSDFSATALWLANVETDADGRATAQVTWPDSLTTWKAVARAADRDTRVGQVTHEVRTNKPIMVRPQGPRFFVEGDKATLSAVVTNNTSQSQVVTVKLDVAGMVVPEYFDQLTSVDYRPEEPSAEPVRAYQRSIRVGVPANAQRRVDWWDVTANEPGATTITMAAIAAVDSDAAMKSYPIYEYGIEQFIAQAATIREKENRVEKTLTLTIPQARREGSETLTIHVEPTLARSMVNALPYLAEYPYGCVEQTLSRFVPAAITARVLEQLGIEDADLKAKLPEMIDAGLGRLYDFQHGDGGWAWWKSGDSDPFMTAYVVAGLAQASEAGVEVRRDVLERGAQFLSLRVVKFEDQPDMVAFALYALATAHGDGGHRDLVDAAYRRLWEARDGLNPYTRALFALACHGTERGEWAQVLVRNMRNGIVEDAANGTAHWGESGVYWRWSQGGVEATAFGLRALLAIDPENPTIDPAMTWLVRNRRGSRWKSTRDTAVVIGALADYITARGEDKPAWTAEVRVNGQTVKTLSVEPGAVFDFEGTIDVPAELLRSGENTVTITREGSGVLYASAWLTYFTREEKIPAAGNEVFIERRYHRVTQRPTLAGEYQELREELREGDALASGDRVEVELSIDAKNHYEYLLIEDLKAAGMEPVELRSGWTWGDGSVSAQREFRDEKTAFFISYLPEGRHTIRYTLRAEVPGTFHALPAQIEAMYVPEIRGNSAGRTIPIDDETSVQQ
jgi:hypothetical protein